MHFSKLGKLQGRLGIYASPSTTWQTPIYRDSCARSKTPRPKSTTSSSHSTSSWRTQASPPRCSCSTASTCCSPTSSTRCSRRCSAPSCSVRHSACSSHLLGAPAPQRPQRRTARAAAQPFISHPLRAPQHEWRRTSSTRVAADFLNARRKPAKGPRPRMKTFGNWVHILVIKWQVRFAKFLEMFYFSPSYLFSRVDKR